MQKFACVILAAGQGTRMHSEMPKPLHKVAGQSMVRHVIDAASALSPEKIIVVIGENMGDMAVEVAPHLTAVQKVANGTGGAVKPAAEHLQGFDGDVVVLFGDTPLVTSNSITKLLDKRREHSDTGLVYSAMRLDNPASYGRMVLGDGDILERIVEFKDANDDERQINLCNGGIMCADGTRLFDWLDALSNDNAQAEYYLTDLPAIARKENLSTRIVEVPAEDMEGVNSRLDLAMIEKKFQNRLRIKAMEEGITLQDPDTTYFSFDTKIAKDVTIGQSVVFGVGVEIETGANILPFCHLEQCIVHSNASVGPFARLRPNADIGENAKVGNFVEIKKTKLGRGAKVSHLSYLGDAVVGERANIGAGTITCNYDGFLKYKTVIEADAFIGSNSALVAPVTVGAGAFVGAGSVISSDVPSNALGVTRAKLLISKEWAKNFREKKQAEKEGA